MAALLSLLRKYKEVVLYLVFGVLTTIVDILVFSLLAHTCLTGDGFQMQLANLLCTLAVILLNYVFSKLWVFRTKTK